MSRKSLSFYVIAATAILGVGCSGTDEGAGRATEEPLAESRQGVGEFCGGFAAIPCPEGLVCVDDPRDQCDPATGGADCGGICVRPHKAKKDKTKCDDKSDPTLSYISQDPVQCLTLRFACAEGYVPFFNECGCGCQLSP